MIVYTCITNQKDSLINVPPQEGVTYYCFSDKPFKHHVWKYLPIHSMGQSDGRRIARRYKILSHIYFPGETTIWMDGRIKLNLTPLEMLRKYPEEMSLRLHPSRKCIYKEGIQVKKIGYEDPDIVDIQLTWLMAHGFPRDFGLHETGVIIRRPSVEVEQFCNEWWSIVSSLSKRDQLSFDFVRYTNSLTIGTIDREDVRVYKHQRITNLKT